MIENKFKSFAQVEKAISIMKDEVAPRITKTFEETRGIYDELHTGWSSANARSQSEKMINYAEEAEKIAKNISEVSNAIERFKTTTHIINETK